VASWLVTTLPLKVVLNPFEVFIAALCVVSGLPLIVHTGSQPGSLQELLPHSFVVLWGVELTLGGTISLIGLLSSQHRVERWGIGILAPAAFAYGIAILVVTGPSGGVAAAVVLGFAFACVVRLAVLVEVRTAIRRAAELERL
jgi:hypothetical protein